MRCGGNQGTGSANPSVPGAFFRSKKLLNPIIKNAKVPKITPTNGSNETHFIITIQPPSVVPNVTPQLPNEIIYLNFIFLAVRFIYASAIHSTEIRIPPGKGMT